VGSTQVNEEYADSLQAKFSKAQSAEKEDS
jgi:hypothetical protein